MAKVTKHSSEDVIGKHVEDVSSQVRESGRLAQYQKVIQTGDPVEISQVIVNLLSNASKFSSEKSRIRLRLVNEQDSLRLSVEDDGIGLDTADVEKLFKPFPNIIRPTVTEKSIGLGLSICKGYLDLHGGWIWVESDGRGKGSTFHFTLPLALS